MFGLTKKPLTDAIGQTRMQIPDMLFLIVFLVQIYSNLICFKEVLKLKKNDRYY